MMIYHMISHLFLYVCVILLFCYKCFIVLLHAPMFLYRILLDFFYTIKLCRFYIHRYVLYRMLRFFLFFNYSFPNFDHLKLSFCLVSPKFLMPIILINQFFSYVMNCIFSCKIIIGTLTY